VLLYGDGTPIKAANNPIARVLRTGQAERRILMWFLREGKSVWLETTLQPLRSGGVVCSLIDVTERREAERDLREARDRAERYLNMAGSIIVALDRELRVTMINRAGLELLGYSEGELMGAEWIRGVVPPDARAEATRMLGSMLDGVDPRDLAADSAEGPLITKAGEVRTIEWQTAVLKGADGVATGLLCSGNDVTERIRSEQAIAHLAYHDQLTGLPNRALLEEHLEVALARAEREERELALLFLDLDNFKIVNDSLGHAAGDRLLQLVAERLTSITRASDLLARHGGDELLLLLTDIEGGTTVEVAESVARKILRALSKPFEIGGTEFEIGASVGVAVFPHDGRSAAALLRTADATMYQAKAAGRNRVALHRPGLGLDGAGELISATTRLRRALTDGELTVHYQPILSVPERSVAAIEALVRWEDPRRGLVPASDFLQLAEETGLMESIGDLVIETVCRQAAWWRDRGLEARIHFHLSPRQLRQRRVIDSIGEQIVAAGLEPDWLTAEIEESAAMTESRRDSSMLKRLRNLGVHLAVDNFGAGNSSLARLRELPVEQLKLHRLLLRAVPYDRNANALARAAIELASGLGMRAIAEGVETEDQWRFLVEHGCPLAQGFHLGRPAPAEEITALLQRVPGA
jgi:diguanylate cyclase (GGDEF)-like protein/PAS domain S-box-containing protein